MQAKTSPNNHISTLIYDLEISNNALYIRIFTNVTTRPIRLIVDTGAVITLVACDLIMEMIEKTNCKLNLCGVTGQEHIIQTKCLIYGFSSINDRFLGITMHLIDRKYAGPADGYLGFDFLSQHKAKIDIANSKLYFNWINNIQPNENKDEIESTSNKSNKISIDEENPIHVLGYSYEFPGEKRVFRDIDSKKKEFKKYFKRIYHYEHKIYKGRQDKPRAIFSTDYETNETNSDDVINETFSYKNDINEQFVNELLSEFAPSNTIKPFENYALNFDDFIRDKEVIEEYNLNKDIIERITKINQKLKLEHCSPENKLFVYSVISAFPYQFYVEGDVLGSTNIIQHEIKLIPGAKPVNLRQYRIPHSHKKPLQDIIEDYELRELSRNANQISILQQFWLKRKMITETKLIFAL